VILNKLMIGAAVVMTIVMVAVAKTMVAEK